MRHRLGIPHRITLFGIDTRIRWGSTTDRKWVKDKKDHWATIVEQGDGSYLITLHPSLRRDPVRAWDAFIHEVLHAVHWKLGDVYLPHSILERIDGPLGSLAVELALKIPCRCAPCSKSTVAAKQTDRVTGT